jgi:hypothetical protein
MTSLPLARAGWHVVLLERVGIVRRSAAAPAVDPRNLLRLLGDGASVTVLAQRRGRCGGRRRWTPGDVGGAARRLQAAATGHATIEVHNCSPVVGIGQDEGHAWAVTGTGDVHTGDLLMGADGYRSVVRKAVAPDRPDATGPRLHRSPPVSVSSIDNPMGAPGCQQAVWTWHPIANHVLTGPPSAHRQEVK